MHDLKMAARIFEKNQKIRALYLEIVELMDQTTRTMLNDASIAVMNLDFTQEAINKRTAAGEDIAPYLPDYLRTFDFRSLSYSLYLLPMVFSQFYPQFLWTDKETELLGQRLRDNPRHIIEDEELLNRMLEKLKHAKDRMSHITLLTLGLSMPLYLSFVMPGTDGRVILNQIYTGYHQLRMLMDYFMPSYETQQNELRNQFVQAYKEYFPNPNAQITYTQPIIYSASNTRFLNARLTFTFTVTQKSNDSLFQSLIIRALCPHAVSHVTDEGFCTTLEFPFNTLMGRTQLTKYEFKKMFKAAHENTSRVSAQFRALGSLSQGFIGPFDHQDDYRFLIITDPFYRIQLAKERWPFLIQREHDCVINLLDLKKEEQEQFLQKIQPEKKPAPTTTPVVIQATATNYQNSTLYMYGGGTKAPQNKIEKQIRGVLGGAANTDPRLAELINIEEKLPVWDDDPDSANAAYPYRQIRLLKSIGSKQPVDSHVYIRIPEKDYKQFAEHLFLCDQGIDKHKGFKLLEIIDKTYGCFESHDHSDDRYLAYAQSWGTQETVVNGKSQFQRVLLLKIDTETVYTHEGVKRLSITNRRIADSLDIYESENRWRTVCKK
ncbi:MAG: hypothetical protein WC748_04690 [Legionellales bacterium]|jgi:hypothetical protein